MRLIVIKFNFKKKIVSPDGDNNEIKEKLI